MKDHGHAYKLYLNRFLYGAFEYGDDGIVKLLSENCTSQRGTTKFCILTDVQRMNNF
jgi:hypothetical protein